MGSLLVLGGLGAFYLTVRALGTQTSWSVAANDAKAAAEQAAEGLPELVKNEEALRDELRVANAGFGQVLFASDPRPDANGNLNVALGTQDGLTAGADGTTGPLVHVFAPTGEGANTDYIGPFAVLQAQERQASLAPAFTVQPGEPQDWPIGRGDWRLRVDVPPSRAARFGDLDNSLVTQRELLRNRRATTETRRESVAEAQATLAAREAALLGDPNAPEISDAPEVRAGLIAATTAEERDRAADLVELDRLRRAVKNASDRLRSALAENAELVDRLPTDAPPRTAQGQ